MCIARLKACACIHSAQSCVLTWLEECTCPQKKFHAKSPVDFMSQDGSFVHMVICVNSMRCSMHDVCTVGGLMAYCALKWALK